MTIYIAVLYICVNLKCQFFQSETITYNKEICDNEIASQIERGRREGIKVDGICVDVVVGKEV